MFPPLLLPLEPPLLDEPPDDEPPLSSVIAALTAFATTALTN